MKNYFIIVVSLIIEDNGNVLFMRRSHTCDHAPGEWEFVSGRLEHGETLTEAALREAKEETGLTVEIIKMVDTFQYLRGSNQEPAVGMTYHCRKISGDVVISDEHDEYRWISIGEKLSINLPPAILKSYRQFCGQ